MFNRITKDLVIILAVGLGTAFAQAPKEKKVKDQQEYDLYKAVTGYINEFLPQASGPGPVTAATGSAEIARFGGDPFSS